MFLLYFKYFLHTCLPFMCIRSLLNLSNPGLFLFIYIQEFFMYCTSIRYTYTRITLGSCIMIYIIFFSYLDFLTNHFIPLKYFHYKRCYNFSSNWNHCRKYTTIRYTYTRTTSIGVLIPCPLFELSDSP